mmetsp:Transcript_91077/g.202216  ORF Transcript_91077/g.202216 Transcript_91077/m.202216 type:complete len:201 (+) Transcript_91077:181-783(+)
MCRAFAARGLSPHPPGRRGSQRCGGGVALGHVRGRRSADRGTEAARGRGTVRCRREGSGSCCGGAGCCGRAGQEPRPALRCRLESSPPGAPGLVHGSRAEQAVEQPQRDRRPEANDAALCREAWRLGPLCCHSRSLRLQGCRCFRQKGPMHGLTSRRCEQAHRYLPRHHREWPLHRGERARHAGPHCLAPLRDPHRLGHL